MEAILLSSSEKLLCFFIAFLKQEVWNTKHNSLLISSRALTILQRNGWPKHTRNSQSRTSYERVQRLQRASLWGHGSQILQIFYKRSVTAGRSPEWDVNKYIFCFHVPLFLKVPTSRKEVVPADREFDPSQHLLYAWRRSWLCQATIIPGSPH